jgi:hypothetical protein
MDGSFVPPAQRLSHLLRLKKNDIHLVSIAEFLLYFEPISKLEILKQSHLTPVSQGDTIRL